MENNIKQLPERFSVYAETLEEAQYITQKQREICGNSAYLDKNMYYRFCKDNRDNYGYNSNSYLIEASWNNYKITHEFTFEEFKQFFMKQEKEIIGYKLVKEEYKEAALKLCNTVSNWENVLAKYDISINQKNYIKKLTEAGVLKLWFEPVYVPEKPKEIIVNMGEFNLTVKKDGIFHSSEDITSYVEGIVIWWENVMKSGNLKFGKNYDFLIPSTNITIEKSGCENKQTKLNQWINCWKEYEKLQN
jgi:hypothetical protein